MSSIHDVAELAQTSVASVSRVLSNSPHRVSDDLRARVLAAADTLNFVPNRLARGLVTARSYTMGAIVSDVADPYFGEVTRGIEDAARAASYQVFVCSSDRDADREYEYVRALLSYRVDALCLAGGSIDIPSHQERMAKVLAAFEERGGVVVTLGPNSYSATGLDVDNNSGIRAVVKHLSELSHRVVGFIAADDRVRTSRVRKNAFRRAARSCGMSTDASLVERAADTPFGGADAAVRLMERRSDVTAIVAADDQLAVGAIRGLRSIGRKVPDDVSVTGFEDNLLAQFCDPGLTTVALPMNDMGKWAVELALTKLAGGSPDNRAVTPRLVVRGSTARARRR